MGSLVRYVTVRDGRVRRYAMGGGVSDSADALLAAGPDILLRWLEAFGDDRDGDDGTRVTGAAVGPSSRGCADRP